MEGFLKSAGIDLDDFAGRVWLCSRLIGTLNYKGFVIYVFTWIFGSLFG